MTLGQMIKKYLAIQKDGHESVLITQVLQDLNQVRRWRVLRKADR